MITGKARIYAIIGDPIDHVRTPLVFNTRFEAGGHDAILVPLLVPLATLARTLDGLRTLGNFGGCVVTAPLKGPCAELCDVLEGNGRLAGAVNALRRDPDGRLVGDLFDGLGFVAGLRAHGIEPRGKRVFIAGAGGAGTALAFALAGEGAASLTLYNRTADKAEALAARVRDGFPRCEVRVGGADPSGHDIAVNATALGLVPGDPMPFDVARLEPPTIAAEVIMKPETTAMLEAAAARGCRIHQGKHMLDGQAALLGRFLRMPGAQAG
jgi:shikimate dehydrogenase